MRGQQIVLAGNLKASAVSMPSTYIYFVVPLEALGGHPAKRVMMVVAATNDLSRVSTLQ